jgi:hypothetical protein
MRNKLPILLALVLMAVSAMPWLRSLESQRWSRPSGATTVPPPEQAIPASRGQEAGIIQPANSQTPAIQTPKSEITSAPPRQENRGSSETGVKRDALPPPKSAAEGSPKAHLAEESQAPPKCQDLFDSAVQSVESRTFISARVKQQGDLFGRQVTGEGRYYELRRGPIPKMRLELTVVVGSISCSLVQVCTGATFWTYRKLPNGESLSKIDAVRAFNALAEAAEKLPREAMALSPRLGGLGRLIRGVNERFEFTSAAAEQLDGLPVWKLSGKWRDAQLAKLLPDQKRAIEKNRPFDLTRLPEHLPDSVTVYLGQADCFPFRIDYLRGTGKSQRCLMSLEFRDLNFNGPIDSGQFVFPPPGNLDIYDRTDQFIEAIGR